MVGEYRELSLASFAGEGEGGAKKKVEWQVKVLINLETLSPNPLPLDCAVMGVNFA